MTGFAVTKLAARSHRTETIIFSKLLDFKEFLRAIRNANGS